jgi:hypothetical protein
MSREDLFVTSKVSKTVEQAKFNELYKVINKLQRQLGDTEVDLPDYKTDICGDMISRFIYVTSFISSFYRLNREMGIDSVEVVPETMSTGGSRFVCCGLCGQCYSIHDYILVTAKES